MNDLRDFFLFCSGSNATILKKTPTEINKHAGIGATIFFTGVFASLAGGYAVYTVFNSYFAAILIGLLWGAMIFNLDRYIVSTLKMRKSIFRNFMGAVPRIALALIIAIVIAKPLELKIFNSEIEAELALMQQEHIIEQEQLLKSRFDTDVLKSEAEISALKGEITAQETKRDELDAIAILEADGTGGSMKRNMGPIYKAKKADALKAQKELDALNAQLSPQINTANQKLLGLNEKIATELGALNIVQRSGFAARLEALDRISEKSQAILIANLFIMLLFIAIETTPIFVKLISSRSPYDYELNKHEHVFAMNHELKTNQLSNEIKNKMNYDAELGSYKTQMAISTEKQIIKETVEESFEKLKANPTGWKNIFKRGSIFEV